MPRAIVIEQHGGPEVLRFVDTEEQDPGPGEVRVQHTAIGVNFTDVYHRTGLYPVPQLPSGLGLEAVGRVVAVGPGVEELRTGDRVGTVSGPPGAYSEQRCYRASKLIPLPDEVSDEAAAALLLKGLTVEYLIRRCFQVKAGQVVLLHAAAGGVGLIACQWLRHLGATVIGTAGTANKAELAAEYGATHTIVYTQEDFRRRVHEITGGRGVDVVFDSVGRDTFAASLDCLRPRGMMVSFGNASGKPDPFDIAQLAQKGSLYLTRPTLMTYTAERDELLAGARALFEVVAYGAVRPLFGQRWPLSEASHAQRALEARATTGSLLLIP